MIHSNINRLTCTFNEALTELEFSEKEHLETKTFDRITMTLCAVMFLSYSYREYIFFDSVYPLFARPIISFILLAVMVAVTGRLRRLYQPLALVCVSLCLTYLLSLIYIYDLGHESVRIGLIQTFIFSAVCLRINFLGLVFAGFSALGTYIIFEHSEADGGLLLADIISLVVSIGFALVLSYLTNYHKRKAHNYNNQILRLTEQRSQFLATMSHEIRTPLNGMVGMIKCLVNDLTIPKPAQEQLQVVERSSRQLVLLLNDVLDTAKLDQGGMQIANVRFNLQQNLSDIIQMFTANLKPGVSLIYAYSDTCPRYVNSDPLRIGQIAKNLVSNAIKFTDTGSVTLSVSCTHDSLSISVSDTGIGISDDHQAALFERYKQASAETASEYGGTGLGLNICKQLAELIGGEINVTSEIGLGSTFTVTIPLEMDMGRPCDPPKNPANLKNIAILVADDNEVNRMVIKAQLERLDAQPKVVSDGLDVIELVKHNDYDAIFLDIEMIHLGGRECVSRLITYSKENPSWRMPKLIAYSGSCSYSDRADYLSIGFADMLPKPASDEQILSILCEEYSDSSVATL